MFLTPKIFNFHIYRSVDYSSTSACVPVLLTGCCLIHVSNWIENIVTRKIIFYDYFNLVRQHDFPPSQRLNGRHLPAIPLSKYGASNNTNHNSLLLPTTTATNTATNGANNRFQSNNLFFQSLSTPTSTSTNATTQLPRKFNPKSQKYTFESSHNKPRMITIVKQGVEKPHKTISILLNRRTIQTYEQLLADISEAFGYQKNRQDKVCRSERKKIK